jgi:hypothetical protein
MGNKENARLTVQHTGSTLRGTHLAEHRPIAVFDRLLTDCGIPNKLPGGAREKNHSGFPKWSDCPHRNLDHAPIVRYPYSKLFHSMDGPFARLRFHTSAKLLYPAKDKPDTKKRAGTERRTQVPACGFHRVRASL